MVPLAGEPVPNLLIDTCGWIAVIDARINIDIEMERTIGQANWILPLQVKEEIDRLAEGRNDLLLDLLANRSTIITDEEGHTDDVLVRLAQRLDAPVLTVDKILKRRLVAAGCTYLEVVRDRSLRLVD
jgi:rRNA-processing protein FCF1